MPFDMEAIGKGVERLTGKVEDLTDAVEDTVKEEKEESKMGDIAGLLALMQGNKNMDLPGMLALCKERGYDRGWGNDGMFMFVFLILFLFAGGGWDNLGRGRQQQFQDCAGVSCGPIVEMYSQLKDQIFNTQTTLSTQAQQLQTWLCQVTDAINAATRNQGDRAVEATQSVKDQLFQCCCDVKGLIAGVQNKVDGLYGHTSVLQERNINAMQAMECRLQGEIKENRRIIELGFERASCERRDLAKDQEIARLSRENDNLKNTLRDTTIANHATEKMQAWFLNNYTPTRTQQ